MYPHPRSLPPSASARSPAVLYLLFALPLGGFLSGCGSTPADAVRDTSGDAIPTDADDSSGEPTPDADAEPTDDPRADTSTPDPPDDDVASDPPPDTLADTLPDTLPDTPPDSGTSTDTGADADWGDPCEPPVRMRPTSGPVTGGTIIEVAGSAWWIGALAWWMDLEDHVLAQAWLGPDPSQCTLTFVTQPATAGRRDATVYYGGPEQVGDRVEPTGTFTFVDEPGLGPGAWCNDDADCPGAYQVCDLGLGACIVNRCASAACGRRWSGGPCSTLRGCVEDPECDSDDDCRLIYSSCSCIAVPASDPREILDDCLYEGCFECDGNRCESESIRAACVEGVCEAARP